MRITNRRSYSWWFESHNRGRQSSWLVSTLSELEEKTSQVLKLIEEDADSFAQRAEMYYKKRPELVNRIEELYRSHRSLAEQYEKLKLEAGVRRPFPQRHAASSDASSESSVHSCNKEDSEMEDVEVDKNTQTERRMIRKPVKVPSTTSSCSSDSEESEVDDPHPEDSLDEAESRSKAEPKIQTEAIKTMNEEIERLKQENAALRDQLAQKDEEKREVIRQLSICVDILKEENVSMKKYMKDAKKWVSLDLKKLKEVFSGKLFGGGSLRI